MYSSHNSHDPIMAPTPAPIVVNTALPVAAPAPSSNSYNFDPSGLTPAQQLAYAQAQQQHQQQHLKKMRQRLPHVSGRELQTLHKQIKDLQHKQHMQTLQTLRLAQVQEKQAFNYLDSAFKTRQKPNTYHRVNFQLKGKSQSGSPHMSRKLDGPAGMTAGAHLPSAALLHEAKLVGTPDTLSETGSLKSGRSRRNGCSFNNSRTLPFLPPEEPAPLPTQKKSHDRINSSRRNIANFRQSSLDGMTSRSFGGLSRPRPSNSETNLRKLAFDERSRPTSALGLIQASSVVSSRGPSSAAREQEKRILESILPPDLRHLIGGRPSTWTSIQQIESSLKSVSTTSEKSGPSASEIARLNAEKKLFGNQRERIVAEMQRYAATKDPRLRAEMKHKLNPVLDAQLNRNRSRRHLGHRRNLSDGGHVGEDHGFPGLPHRPYSSMSGGYLGGSGGLDPLAHDPFGLDNSQSYLGVDNVLRDTAISGYDSEQEARARLLASHSSRTLHRRASAGGLEGLSHHPPGAELEQHGHHLHNNNNNHHHHMPARRPHSSMSGKMGARSWHPSPFGSDDEEGEHHFFKEE